MNIRTSNILNGSNGFNGSNGSNDSNDYWNPTKSMVESYLSTNKSIYDNTGNLHTYNYTNFNPSPAKYFMEYAPIISGGGYYLPTKLGSPIVFEEFGGLFL